MDSEMVVSYSWGSTAGFRMVEYDMERFFLTHSGMYI